MASCEVDPESKENTGTGSLNVDQPTFAFPLMQGANINIEFCDRCRWLHRATWVQTELLLSFPPPAITAITLIPRNTEDTAGRFRVWLCVGETNKVVWDRKSEGGFPELKVLKQRIRDIVQPGRSLGHSDVQ